MEHWLVKLEQYVPPNTLKELRRLTTEEEKPVEENQVIFDWQDSLMTLTTLLQTGRPGDTKPTPKKKKVWKWLENQEAGNTVYKKPLPPVDYSNVGLKSFEMEVQVQPRPTGEPLKTDASGKFLSSGARFRRNGLTSMEGMDSFLEQRFADPTRIQWLDLSYNAICEILPVLSMMPNLKILYLHSNCFDNLDEVRKLRYLPNLQCLTLFGNPLEASVDYRLKLMAAIPTLKKIDWTVITARERESARFYVRMMEQKDKDEIEEMKRQEKAAEERREKKRKAAEKRRKRREEAAKEQKPETKAGDVTELDFEPKKKKEEIKKEELFEEVAEVELIEEEITEEEVEEKSELEEGIVPVWFAHPGPLDVKGKYKRYPDCLSSASLIEEAEECLSEDSLFSTDTVTVEQIQREFNLLKEMEQDHNWESTVCPSCYGSTKSLQ